MAELDNQSDPVVLWVRCMATHAAEQSADGARSYRVSLRVRVNSQRATGFDVLTSPKVPKPGEPYYGWSKSADNYTYMLNAAVIDPLVSLAHAAPRRLESDPYLFDLELTYEGEGSPLLQIPEVEYGSTPYQVAALTDVNKKPYLNSAGDPLEGGVLVDGDRQVLTITRTIPWAAWDPEAVRGLKHSLNQYPFRHGELRRVVPAPPPDPVPPGGTVPPPVPPTIAPVESPPGSCKLTDVTCTRVVLTRGPSVAATRFGARVTAKIEIDHRTFIDNDGKPKPQLWRGVKIDAGHQRLIVRDGKTYKERIPAGAYGHGGLALLDGAGGVLVPAAPPNSPPPTCPPGWVYDAATASCKVPPPATPPPSPPSACPPGQVRGPSGDCVTPPAPTDPVVPAVIPVPKVLVFDDYPTKDWSPLASILGNW